jgi:hypothetical protein
MKWASIKIAELPPQFRVRELDATACRVATPYCAGPHLRGIVVPRSAAKRECLDRSRRIKCDFSLIHDNAFASDAIGRLTFTERFLVGLGASALAIKYRSLRPSLVMHATLNAIAGFDDFFNSA